MPKVAVKQIPHIIFNTFVDTKQYILWKIWKAFGTHREITDLLCAVFPANSNARGVCCRYVSSETAAKKQR